MQNKSRFNQIPDSLAAPVVLANHSMWRRVIITRMGISLSMSTCRLLTDSMQETTCSLRSAKKRENKGEGELEGRWGGGYDDKGRKTLGRVSWLASWCFEPSQPHRGLHQGWWGMRGGGGGRGWGCRKLENKCFDLASGERSKDREGETEREREKERLGLSAACFPSFVLLNQAKTKHTNITVNPHTPSPQKKKIKKIKIKHAYVGPT